MFCGVVAAVVPSAVSISDEVLSVLSTDAPETAVDDESVVDDDTEVVDDSVVDDVDTLPAAVVPTDGATGGGVVVAGSVGDVVLTGSGGGGTGLVVVGAGAVDVGVEDVDDVLDVEDVVLVDDEVELVEVDAVVVDGGGAVGAGALTGGVEVADVVLVLVEVVGAVEPDAVVEDFNVSAPVPPLKTTGMVD